MKALLSVAAVVATELAARRLVRGRAQALLAAYAALGLGCRATASIGERGGPGRPRRSRLAGPRLVAAVGLALAGYPLGRALTGSRSTGPPPDGMLAELASLGALVPLVEERIWGAVVEPTAGPTATGVAFAVKHVLVDARWDRVPGLALYWWGLAQVRRDRRRVALALHCAINAAGVVLGHAGGRDQF